MATTTASIPTAAGRLVLRPLAAFAAIGSLIAIGLWIALRFPQATPIEAVLLAVLLAAGSWMLFSERYEWSLAVLLLYVGLLDGYLKLKTGSSNITLLRDLLLYAIVVGALVRAAIRGERLRLPPLKVWVIVWVLIVLVQIFNPEAGTLYHSVASVRQHIEWVPLFFLGYMVVRDTARLRGFLMLLLFVAAVNGVVGLVQFNLSPEELSNWGPGYERVIEGDEDVSGRTFTDDEGNERIRPFGLGGDSGFAGHIAFLAVAGALALLSLSRATMIRIVTGVLAAWVAVAIATSQARVVVVGSVIVMLAFAALTVTSRAGLRTVMGITVAVIVAYAAVSVISGGAEEGSFDRYTSVSNPSKAISTTIDYREGTWSQVPIYAEKYPLGAGLGSGGPASTLAGGSTSHGALNAESQPTFMLIEVGIPGLLVMLGFNLTLIWLSITRIRRIPNREIRLLLTALAAPLMALMVTWAVGPATASTPKAPFLWFAAGVLAYWLLGPGWRQARENRESTAESPAEVRELPAIAQPQHG